MTDTEKAIEEDKKNKIIYNIDSYENYEKYKINVKFTSTDINPIEINMIETERLIEFFSKIKKLVPKTRGNLLKLTYENEEMRKSEFSENNEETIGFFGGVICNHRNYKITKEENPDQKIIELNVVVTLYPMMIINFTVFANKISDENKMRAKNFIEKFVKDNQYEYLTYNLSFNQSYFEISKEPLEILIIMSDENFINDVVKNDFDKAERILFWTECQKAKDLMKKFPKKIISCNSKFDFLLTPRYFSSSNI